MNFKQLSHKIDQKLSELDAQVKQEQKKLQKHPESADAISQEIARLDHLKFKLRQSLDIAKRAHELQTGQEKKKLKQQHYLSIALVVFSVLGLLMIAWVAFH